MCHTSRIIGVALHDISHTTNTTMNDYNQDYWDSLEGSHHAGAAEAHAESFFEQFTDTADERALTRAFNLGIANVAEFEAWYWEVYNDDVPSNWIA